MVATGAVGVMLAALSAVFNGSFGVLSKVESVQRQGVSPLHFNFWMACGLVLSTAPLLPFHQDFTAWGMLSGVLFVLSTGCTFVAISTLGISVASAMWCGTAIIASFTWGLRVNGDKLSHKGFAIPALLLLVGGLAGIGFIGRLSEMIRDQKEEGGQRDAEAQAILEEEERLNSPLPPPEERVLDPMEQHHAVPEGPERYGIGCVAAIAAGLFGGLILAPKSFTPHIHGIAYLPSMALGVLVAAPMITFVLAMLSGDQGLPNKASLKVAALFGIAAGTLWNLGNILSILATERIGIAVAYPIFQCGLFVAGLLGIGLFNEFERQCIPAYLLAGTALIIGATCLALAK